MKVKENGTWKDIKAAYIKQSGEWKRLDIWIKDVGVWRKILTSVDLPVG